MHRKTFLFNLLQHHTILPCVAADVGVQIEKGYILVHSLEPSLVKDGILVLGYGPEEIAFARSRLKAVLRGIESE